MHTSFPLAFRIQLTSNLQSLLNTLPLHRMAYCMVHQPLGKWAGKFVNSIY